jgi:long-chain acyl-CoA synthetase
VLLEPWTVENGMLTPTMKVRRAKVLERHGDVVAALYKGH